MILLSNKFRGTRVPFEIDDIDNEYVSSFNWCIASGYVSRRIVKDGFYTSMLILHIDLLGPAPTGFYWDHRDRNTMNNKRDNLRLVTPSVSTLNQDKTVSNTSGFRGVYDLHNGTWKSLIQINKRVINLGIFPIYEQAVNARITAEREYGIK